MAPHLFAPRLIPARAHSYSPRFEMEPNIPKLVEFEDVAERFANQGNDRNGAQGGFGRRALTWKERVEAEEVAHQESQLKAARDANPDVVVARPELSMSVCDTPRFSVWCAVCYAMILAYA